MRRMWSQIGPATRPRAATRPPTRTRRTPAHPIVSVTATDKSTVVYKLAQPTSFILQRLATMTTGEAGTHLPREADNGFDPRTGQIGTGGFILDTYEPSVRPSLPAQPGLLEHERALRGHAGDAASAAVSNRPGPVPDGQPLRLSRPVHRHRGDEEAVARDHDVPEPRLEREPVRHGGLRMAPVGERREVALPRRPRAAGALDVVSTARPSSMSSRTCRDTRTKACPSRPSTSRRWAISPT